jgi:four helix bundle protein
VEVASSNLVARSRKLSHYLLTEFFHKNKLADLSLSIAVSIIEPVKILRGKHEPVISNQTGRSGKSIGANIREANYAHRKADFISKLEIAFKEANEAGYWLELFNQTGYN